MNMLDHYQELAGDYLSQRGLDGLEPRPHYRVPLAKKMSVATAELLFTPMLLANVHYDFGACATNMGCGGKAIGKGKISGTTIALFNASYEIWQRGFLGLE
jgi:hypothetical protein